VEHAAWQSLHPNSLTVGRLSGALTTAMLGVVAFFGLIVMTLSRGLPVRVLLVLASGATLVIVLSAVGAWVVPERRFRYTRYRLDELGLLIRRGRFFHTEVAVLRSRIQHTDVRQGPVERAFGLGTLVVYTAGTSHAEIDLAGISWDEATRLRAALTGVGAHGDADVL
jgi:membrane protein YdbS with pleckstrin-like domain